jgi:hypothetical protein
VGERVSLFREPDAGNLPVRFDEREQETGTKPNRTEVTWRKPRRISTGRLQLLRLFSTLLAISLIEGFLGAIACVRRWPPGKCFFTRTKKIKRALAFYEAAGYRCVVFLDPVKKIEAIWPPPRRTTLWRQS